MKKQIEAIFPISIKEIVFLFLILLSIFSFLALISFDKNDISSFSYPPQEVRNLGGTIGANLSNFLYLNFGSVSFFVVFFIFFVGIVGFISEDYPYTLVKITSALVMFTAMCITFHICNFTLFLPYNFYKSIGGGGIIGKVLGELMAHYFGSFGTILLSSYLLGISTVISTNGLILTGMSKLIKFTYPIVVLSVKYAWIFLMNAYGYIYKKFIEKKKDIATFPGHLDTLNHQKEQPSVQQELPPIVQSEKPHVSKEETVELKNPVQKKSKTEEYEFPSIDLLEDAFDINLERGKVDINEEKEILRNTLTSFEIDSKVVGVEKGPSVTTYELELGPGTRLQKVLSVADDLAIALKAPSVRVIAPIPGKSTIGIEVPNVYKDIVTLKELLKYRQKYASYKLPIFLGKSASGDPVIEDLSEFPHMLIAGTTGSGKSVCINSIIVAFLYTKTPKELKMILIDPKVVELSFYNDIPHLFCPVITDVNKAKKTFQWLISEMDDRYDLFSKIGVKKIEQYNKMRKDEIIDALKEDGEETPIVNHPMEYLVVIVDELNDLMMAANKEVESSILRLSQKARAVGIHLILATQRPSVDVITGLIKANIPARIAFKVVSKVDSRTILDRMGAEKLLGKGDMLFLKPGAFDLMRIQGCYLSEKDIEKVSEYWKQYKVKCEEPLEILETQCENPDIEILADKDEEELLEEAIKIVLQSKRGSVSLVQRKLGIGYCRAARLIERMGEMGLVGEYRGAKPREVLVTYDEYIAKKRR